MNSLTKQIQELDHDIELMEAIEEVIVRNKTYRIENCRNKISKLRKERNRLLIENFLIQNFEYKLLHGGLCPS